MWDGRLRSLVLVTVVLCAGSSTHRVVCATDPSDSGETRGPEVLANRQPHLDGTFPQPLVPTPSAPIAGKLRSETGGMSAARIRELSRPTFNVDAEWQARTNDVGISNFNAAVSVPTYPFFGPPPPIVRFGVGTTLFDRPQGFDLPSEVYEATIGVSWIRPVNDRWTWRLTLGTAFATDGENLSSDAWQFRGGAFAMYRPDTEWTWIVGVLALGREDLPVVPAVGAIYQPTERLRFDLTLPRPRVAFCLAEDADRQQWAYVGAALNGGTWAYTRRDGRQDQLSYGDWRAVVGWESTPRLEPGMPFARGRRMTVEAGYVFSRDFEFASDETEIPLDPTFMLQARLSF